LLALVLIGGFVAIRDYQSGAAARQRAAAELSLAQVQAREVASQANAARAAADLAREERLAERQFAKEEQEFEAKMREWGRAAAPREEQETASASPMLGEPGGGITKERARAAAEHIHAGENGTRVVGCDQKADDIVECNVETRDSEATCNTFVYIRQPSFQREIQMANGADYCTMRSDGYVMKISDGDPTDFSTLRPRFYR
jgi:hypothetical protein